MICPNCNNNAPDGTAFCPNCGANLTGAQNQAPQPGAQNQFNNPQMNGQQFNNGQPNPQQFNNGQPNMYAPEVKKKKSPLKIILIIVGIIVVLFIILCIASSGSSSSSTTSSSDTASSSSDVGGSSESSTSPYSVYNNMSASLEGSGVCEFTLDSKESEFLKAHPELFPAVSADACSSYTDQSITYSDIESNSSAYGDSLMTFTADVSQLFTYTADELGLGVELTEMFLIDDNWNYYDYLYLGSVDVSEGDKVTVYGLPLEMSSTEDTTGGYTDCIILAGSSIQNYEQTLTTDNASDPVLWESSGIKITYKGVEVDDLFGDVNIKVLIENNSNQKLTVRMLDLSVNDFTVSNWFYEDVGAGKKVNSEITLNSYDLENNNIEMVSKVEFNLEIYDDNYHTLAESGPIVLNY